LKKRILIIGSNGFIGRSLTTFLKNDYSIYKMNRKISTENLKNIRCDISKKKIFNEKISKLPKFDYVINLSGQIEKNKPKMYNSIFVGNKNIIDVFNDKKTKLIFFSSILVYGHSKNLKKPNSTLNPITYYAKIKAKAESLYKKTSKNFNILRISNVYDDKFEKKGLLKNLISAIKNSELIKINQKKSVRNYIHILDLNRIIKLIMLKKLNLNTINIGHENISNEKMIKIFENIFKCHINFKHFNKSFFKDPSIKLGENSFIKKMNFKFNHSIESSLKRLYEK
jgi:nucleoside-diphosphate-sugar epimerase